MAGKRVHQLAKEMGLASKDLLEILQSMGFEITNPLSSVDEDAEKAVKKKLAKPKAAKPRKQAAKTAKKPAKAKVDKKAAKPPAAKKPRKEAPSKPEAKKAGKAAEEAKKSKPETGKEGTPKAGKEAAPPQRSRRERPPERRPAPSRTAKVEEGQKRKSPPAPRAPSKPGERARGGRTAPPRAERPPVTREPVTKPMKKKLRVPAGITVKDFAQRVGRTPAEIMRRLMAMGEMIDVNQSISDEAIMLIADELKMDIEVKSKVKEEAVVGEDAPESLEPRPPVVTVMGHVDHGKTSLLDAIRDTSVTESEMGGITQHIGASVVEFEGNTITFIDTPGHESFTALRARGAQVTDIAVLVVAADDGVMPQTIEAIDHARAAGIPIIVAVNKIDKPEANPTRVRQQLTEQNLLPEEWGGETIYVDVSAKQATNLDHLLEMIVLLAEVNDYRANPSAPASGNIIEARLEKGRGSVATLLVKRGTLKRGDALVAGKTYGRTRALLDDKGKQIEEATPSTPVEILGLNSVPEAGDEFVVVEDDRKARAIAEDRVGRERLEEERRSTRTLSLEDLFKQIQDGQAQEFNLIIKGDTQGSLEAVRDSVSKMQVGDIVVNVIHTGVGAITENDIMLARASNAVVIGFNVRPEPNARAASEKEKVDVRTYRVIYQLLEDIKSALVGMLKPVYEEVQVGLLEVIAVFRVPRQGTVAGVLVKEGEINRNSRVRLVRDGAIIYEGSVASLRRFKDDVRSVSAGYECGVGLENFQDVKEGDLIEVFEKREVPRGEETELS